MSSSGEESSEDNGEKIRNVRSLLIKSSRTKKKVIQDHVLKRKLGDLIFDANFEGGNLGLVEQINRFTYDLMIRPDIANPRFRMWFNFRVSNQRPGQCVIFCIVNLSGTLNLFNEGMTPVVRSRMYPNWVRLHPDQVFYYRSPEHGDRLVLAIAFKFCYTSTINNEYQFALFYPYTVTNLIHFIDRWSVEIKRSLKNNIEHFSNTYKFKRSISTNPTRCHPSSHKFLFGSTSLFRSSTTPQIARSKSSFELTNYSRSLFERKSKKNHLEVTVVTQSILSKPIYRLKVQELQPYNASNLRAIVIGGWSGNFESITSYICQGLADFILSDDIVAQYLRQYVEVNIFPMPDPDSVWTGNSRSDIFGQVNVTQKLCRANPKIYDNLNSLIKSVEELCSLPGAILVIELKVNPHLIGSRFIGACHENTFRMERHLFLPRLVSRFIDGFYLETCLFHSKPNSDRPFSFCSDRENVDQYCFEISPFAYYRRSLQSSSFVAYDQKKYLSMGKSLSYALLEFARTTAGCFLPQHVAEILDSFRPQSDDIDDLVLR